MKEGRGESNVEAFASVARVLDSSSRESATCFSPRRYTCGGITRKAERGAGAFRAKALEVLAERVLESTADALAMAELDSRRRRGQAGSSEDTEERNRREREREGKKRGSSSSSGEMAEYSSTDEGLEREDDSKVRRTAASKPGRATSLKAGNDAPPPGATSRGLRDGRRSAGERSGGCPSLDCSKAECREQARVQEHSRIALCSRSRGSADAWTSGECRRRPDPEFPRSGSGGIEGREMVTRTSSRTAARSSSVDSVIRSSGRDDQSRAGFPPIAPEPEDTESLAKARGERAAPGPPPSLEERGRRRRTQSRSAEDPGGTKIEKERPPPHETSNGGTKPEEGKARGKENEASS